jgi:hypothetical protein
LPERVNPPSLISISGSPDLLSFLRTNIREFNFGTKNEEILKAMKFYQETNGNIGLEGAKCYFDL